MLVLFPRDLQSSFFSFRREGLNLEGLSLRERKFDFRESLSLGRSLGGRAFFFGAVLGILVVALVMTFDKRLQNERGWGSIYRENPCLHLRSNFDVDILLSPSLGLNLIRLKLRVDATL